MPVLTAEPEVGFEPPQEPEAVHAELLVVLQVRFALVPAGTEVGFTLICTVGTTSVVASATSTVTFLVTLPPVPLHVSE